MSRIIEVRVGEKVIQVGNPRMQAFLKAGGSLFVSEKWPDAYTNMHYTAWMDRKWREWRTLYGYYYREVGTGALKPVILNQKQTAEFDRWLQEHEHDPIQVQS